MNAMDERFTLMEQLRNQRDIERAEMAEAMEGRLLWKDRPTVEVTENMDAVIAAVPYEQLGEMTMQDHTIITGPEKQSWGGVGVPQPQVSTIHAEVEAPALYHRPQAYIVTYRMTDNGEVSDSRTLEVWAFGPTQACDSAYATLRWLRDGKPLSSQNEYAEVLGAVLEDHLDN